MDRLAKNSHFSSNTWSWTLNSQKKFIPSWKHEREFFSSKVKGITLMTQQSAKEHLFH